jgi:hypothetical protein
LPCKPLLLEEIPPRAAASAGSYFAVPGSPVRAKSIIDSRLLFSENWVPGTENFFIG